MTWPPRPQIIGFDCFARGGDRLHDGAEGIAREDVRQAFDKPAIPGAGLERPREIRLLDLAAALLQRDGFQRRKIHRLEACSRHHLFQRDPGEALFRPHHLLGRSRSHNAAAILAAIRPQIDDPVGALHHVQIVLDH